MPMARRRAYVQHRCRWLTNGLTCAHPRMPTAHQRAYAKPEYRWLTNGLILNSDADGSPTDLYTTRSDADGSPLDFCQTRTPMAHQQTYPNLECRLLTNVLIPTSDADGSPMGLYQTRMACDERSYNRTSSIAGISPPLRRMYAYPAIHCTPNECYLRAHSDAEYLVPARGNRPHLATCHYWTTFNFWVNNLVTRLYDCCEPWLSDYKVYTCVCLLLHYCLVHRWVPAPEMRENVTVSMRLAFHNGNYALLLLLLQLLLVLSLPSIISSLVRGFVTMQ
jgi:hypothetical protein